MNKKGFTIIEVLVSLVILSIIVVISSNILSSSFESERKTSSHLNNIKELNLSSSIFRRDIRQMANVPLRDFYGNSIFGTFVSYENSNRIMFNTNVKSLSNQVSPIKRIEYFYDNDALIRRQYFSSNPYDQNQFVENKLIDNVSDLNFVFMHENKWHNQWPIVSKTAKKVPILIKLEFSIDNKKYTWLIEPNLPNAYQG